MGIMKFPIISVIICYAIGFILPVLLKRIYKLLTYYLTPNRSVKRGH